MNRSWFMVMFVVSVVLLATAAIHRGPSEPVIGSTILTISEHKQTFPQPNWELRYKSGPFQLKKDRWLKGLFLPKGAGNKQTNPVLTISRDEVRAIYFNSKAQKDSDVVQHMPRSGCYAASNLMPKDDATPGPAMFVVWLASPGPAARAAEHLNSRYPVRLVWSDNDNTEKELLITVNLCEYASFLANLRWFVGERWQEIGHEFPQ